MPTLTDLQGFPFPPLPSARRITDPASRRTVWADMHVVADQWVAGKANACVRHPNVRRGATPNVLRPRYRFKVVGIDAIPNAAQMVEFHPGRDRPTMPFIYDAMRSVAAVVLDDSPVSLGVLRPLPDPARASGKTAIDFDALDRRLDSLVPVDKPQWLAFDGSGFSARTLGRGGPLAAPALAKADGDGGIVLGHCSDSSSESGGAEAGGVRSTRRPFCVPRIVPVLASASRFSGVT